MKNFTLSEGLYCDFKDDKLPGDEARSRRLGLHADHIHIQQQIRTLLGDSAAFCFAQLISVKLLLIN